MFVKVSKLAADPDTQELAKVNTVFALLWVCRTVAQVHVLVCGFTEQASFDMVVDNQNCSA